ncbi:MAG: hypothetical protein MR704_14690 [Clostridia bacterium]|nr:hypothetical protein [Clostridia bacterium]
MNFEEITEAVVRKEELPEDADLYDLYCFHVLTAIWAQFHSKYITKETATRRKEKLIMEYQNLKDKKRMSEEVFNKQIDCINRSERLRVELNRASQRGDMSKELWLKAVECIGAMCGSYAELKSCKEYLANIEYEEQQELKV